MDGGEPKGSHNPDEVPRGDAGPWTGRRNAQFRWVVGRSRSRPALPPG